MLAMRRRKFALLALAVRGDQATRLLRMLANVAKAAAILDRAVDGAGAVIFVQDTSIFAIRLKQCAVASILKRRQATNTFAKILVQLGAMRTVCG